MSDCTYNGSTEVDYLERDSYLNRVLLKRTVCHYYFLLFWICRDRKGKVSLAVLALMLGVSVGALRATVTCRPLDFPSEQPHLSDVR